MRRLRLVSAVSAALSLLAASTARADSPEPSGAATGLAYVVVTNDGSVYVGDLVESVVASHVTIRMATGQIRRFETAEVSRHGPAGQVAPPLPVVNGSSSAPGVGPMQVGAGPGQRAGESPSEAPVAYAGLGAIPVHIVGNGQIQIESANGWQAVCTVPCTTTVDPNGTYKLGGSPYRDSRAFTFPRSPSPLELVAKPVAATSGRRSLAWSFVPAGAAAIVIGSLYVSGVIGSKPVSDLYKGVGGATLGLGALFIGLGIYFFVDTPSSRLETAAGERIAKQPMLRLPGHVALTPSGLAF